MADPARGPGGTRIDLDVDGNDNTTVGTVGRNFWQVVIHLVGEGPGFLLCGAMANLGWMLLRRPEADGGRWAYYLAPAGLALGAGLLAVLLRRGRRWCVVLSVLLIAGSWAGYAWVRDHADRSVAVRIRQFDGANVTDGTQRKLTVDIADPQAVLTVTFHIAEHNPSTQLCVPDTKLNASATGGQVVQQDDTTVTIRPGAKSTLELTVTVKTDSGCYLDLDVSDATLRPN
ncbi:hypothetical protein ABT095_21370 [Kitasatospora sp. NPDC002227]|uniref:hypothetical protein n=1 Tax=Kitasatospora sp. NPDC002227 TaxID=3154773 RepID=UPI003323AF1B